MSAQTTPPRHGGARVPAGVWALGFVSLLMDVSSEMIHSLLPLFLVGTLGISVLAVGVIEGVAESTALVTKVFSGALSDFIGKRKPLALLGYGLGAAMKPLFALAGGVGAVVTARFVDRIGKGIRDAPRDALVADITPPSARGAAFGLRQALDTVGALLGPLLASTLMLLWANDFRAVFWMACVPAVLAVVVLMIGVKEPPRDVGAPSTQPIRREALSRLDRAYWKVVGIGALMSLARFSEAFLVLRAPQVGMALAWVPLVMVTMNGVYAGAAYPFGKLADSVSRTRLLSHGMVVLIAADIVLASAANALTLLFGVALWGLHMAMTQGLLAAMVADTAPRDLRGTAYGIFNLMSGLAMLLSSVIAGALWQHLGPAATFLAGAAFAALTVATLARSRPRRAG